MLEREWVDFGQQERLTVRLKELIRNYPRGIGIIKEFIQNADDAGARSLSVLLDLRVHPAHRVRDPRMEALMGPALLIGNESLFSPRDFLSIQHIGESNKTESGPKTGRFGLGFNTCYNVTDYPSFVTGEDVVCFDPHQNAIARPGGQPGVRGALRDIWETSPDWLATFMAAGLAGHAARHEGTIFRLPLRTPEQAAASEISKESFGKDAFDEIVSQLKTGGPELLLFTKHLLSIAIMEVDEATGKPKVLLRVSTANAEAVAAAREEVLDAIDGSPLPELLAKWRKDPAGLPCVTYTHDFEVAENGQIATQSWRVANGLFSDPQKKLLDATQAMLTVGEKAVPWAGVAAKLVTANGTLAVERVDGHMYCGLPLTDETPLPVHINGYFDLDSSRRALSADRNVIGANRVRVEWNEQLMQHGVAAAYAALLLDLRDIAEGDALAFYETFPDLKVMKSQLLSTLGRSVYAKVANCPTIRACASGKPDWLSIEKVWLAKESLKPPLIAEGKPVADPFLPFHVRGGFETVGQTLNNVTPKALREFLHTEEDIDSFVENSPRPCLRERDWVEEMLRFCLEDAADNSLQGLPLALLCDKKLHTFGHSKAGLIFSASEEQRHIFAGCPHWFIDPDSEKRVGLKAQPKARFCTMTAEGVIVNLGVILGKKSGGTVIDWEPEGDGKPNAEWLAATFAYLAKVFDSDLLKSPTNLQLWPLLPDQHKKLHPLNSMARPMFRPSEPAYKKLVASLELLGIALVTGPSALVDAIRQFAVAHPKCLDAEMTGARLITVLGAHEETLKDYGGAHNPKIHDPLLSFLSDDRFLATYTEPALARLRSLPLFPTTSGGVVRADAPDVFVSTNYTPPSCSPSVTLLKPGPEGRWKKLLHKLKVPRLDQQTLIERVLLPKYGTVAPQDQIAILKWIRDHLTAEVARLDKAEPGSGQKLFKAVREAELVRCTDGKPHKGDELYDPRDPVIREVLGNRAAIPDLALYPATDPTWLPFFELLGMDKTPRAKDLLDYIDALVLQGKAGTAAVAGRLMEIFDFLQKNWTKLAAAHVPDGPVPIEFCTALKNRAWLPAQRSARYMDDYPGFVPPQDRFYRPSEIYPARLVHQVGSVLPVLAGSRDVERDVRIALGMPAQAAFDAVCKHFDRLIELWQKPEHNGIKPQRIETSFKEIYRYFGMVAGDGEEQSGGGDSAAVLQLLQTRYKGKPCIWDPKTARLWKAKDVFLEKVSFFEPRRTQVSYSEDRINAGLMALGRRICPAIDDYREFLRDLHAELGDNAPDETEQLQVLHALRHIADYGPTDTDEGGLPLLARNGRLRLGNALLWEDTIRWRDKIDLSLVPLVHEHVPAALVTRSGVDRISEHLSDELVSEPERSDGHGLEQLCQRASSTIRSEQFADALRRLVRSQFGPNAISNTESVARIRVVAAVSIQVETILNLNGSTARLGEYTAGSFFREEDATLFVAGSSERQLLVALAKAVNAILHPSLSDHAALQDILRAAPEEIEAILYDYEIPAIEPADESQAIFEDESPTQDSDLHEEDESQERADYDEDEMRQSGRDETSTSAGDSGTQKEEGSRELLAPGVRRSTTTTPSPSPGARASEQGGDSGARRTSLRAAEPRPAGGTDDRPPTTPGMGKSGWEDATGARAGGDGRGERKSGRDAGHRPVQRGRIVTYVEGARPDAEDHEPRDSEADAIGDAAVDHVFGIEDRAGRQPVKMDHDNEGFDVVSKEPDGQPRYIEVKGIDGTWGETGVGVSRPQFLCAQKERKRFWLYVVENARSESPKLHCINDPASKITEYRFDSGWKAFATDPGDPYRVGSGQVAAGMRVSYDDGKGTMASGTVTQVERKGLIVRVHIRTDAGGDIKKFINSSMRFSEPEGEVADATNAARTD